MPLRTREDAGSPRRRRTSDGRSRSRSRLKSIVVAVQRKESPGKHVTEDRRVSHVSGGHQRHHGDIRQSRSRSHERQGFGSRRRSWMSRRSRSRSSEIRMRSRNDSKDPKGRDRRQDTFAPKPCKVIGVFGLNYDTSRRDLAKTFSRFGRLDRVDLVEDPVSSVW